MKRKYDVIIIGAGVSGLVCGTKLAKKGLKVLVVEKDNKPGGCIKTNEKNGYVIDCGTHIFGSCGKGGILRYYLDELKVDDMHFIRLDPTERLVFPDVTIEIPQDIEKYEDILTNLYPDEEKNIEPFFGEIIKIARSFSFEKLLARYKNLTFEELLRRYFKNEKLMSILSAQFRYLGCTPVVLAATSMSLMMANYLKGGTYYPRGGSKSFSCLLAKKFKEYGGELFLENEIRQVVIKNKKVQGVVTNKKEKYVSDIVISSGDVMNLFLHMIDKTEIDSEYLKKVENLRIGASFFMVFLGVDASVDLKRKSGWYHFSYGLNLSPSQSLYVFVPSLADASVAPIGKHMVRLTMPFPYKFTEVTDWDVCACELKEKALSIAEKLIPGLHKVIEFEESATPQTIADRTFNSHGSICGWEMTVDQVHDKRLSYATPIEGLYLAGHWTNPGGGVASAATSGWAVADKIMQNLGSKQEAPAV